MNPDDDRRHENCDEVHDDFCYNCQAWIEPWDDFITRITADDYPDLWELLQPDAE